MKKSVKKLALGKMTIANLNVPEMSKKVGGGTDGCCSSPPATVRIKPPIKK